MKCCDQREHSDYSRSLKNWKDVPDDLFLWIFTPWRCTAFEGSQWCWVCVACKHLSHSHSSRKISLVCLCFHLVIIPPSFFHPAVSLYPTPHLSLLPLYHPPSFSLSLLHWDRETRQRGEKGPKGYYCYLLYTRDTLNLFIRCLPLSLIFLHSLLCFCEFIFLSHTLLFVLSASRDSIIPGVCAYMCVCACAGMHVFVCVNACVWVRAWPVCVFHMLSFNTFVFFFLS